MAPSTSAAAGWNRQHLAVAFLRLALAALASQLPALVGLTRRLELTTALSSLDRLKEGLALLGTHKPYDLPSFFHPPIMLLLAPARESNLALHLVAGVLDLATAWNLSKIAPEGKKNLAGLLYSLHPFTVLTSLALALPVSLSNYFVSLAIASAISDDIVGLAFGLSLATHVSLYPALLLPPLTLLLHRGRPSSSLPALAIRTTTLFGFHQALVLLLSRWALGNWSFLSQVYGTILFQPDLTPNIGLGWYFFVEMFDHFRAFFGGVFQLHVLSYAAPLTIYFKDDPLFAATLLLSIISLFKSYPSLGDHVLPHVLALSSFSSLLPFLTRPLPVVLLKAHALLLLPAFAHIWLNAKQGNANFFYASTLVWALGGAGGWSDWMGAWGRKRALEEAQQEEAEKKEGGRDVMKEWKEGRVKLVQI